jgi:hypothetical protein
VSSYRSSVSESGSSFGSSSGSSSGRMRLLSGHATGQVVMWELVGQGAKAELRELAVIGEHKDQRWVGFQCSHSVVQLMLAHKWCSPPLMHHL